MSFSWSVIPEADAGGRPPIIFANTAALGQLRILRRRL